MRDYDFENRVESLRQRLYESMNLAQDLLRHDYLINDNLADDYVEKLFEIPLEILKLIRKL